MFQLKWDMKISIISVDSCRFYRYYSLLPTFIMERNTAAAAKSLQAPPSLGFSRQEHWSGMPFPSPMHESKKSSEVAQSCPTLSDPTVKC